MSKEDDKKRAETGPNSAGQSGDDQGLSQTAEADAESVDELVREGQSADAAAIEGVENAGDPAEVRVRQLRVDDVPEEYLQPDQDR